MSNIICAGFGGQGVLTAGLIIAKTGMDNGKNVTWIPSYGSEMRGGTANCNVKISDGKIASPFVKDIDILIAMNIPSLDKFGPMVNTNGLIIANSSIIGNYNFRKDVRVIVVPATDIANELSNPKGANIVMLGALAKSNEILEKEVLEHGVEAFFLAKGKSNSKNIDCFNKGYTESNQLVF